MTIYQCEARTPGGRVVKQHRREIVDVEDGEQLKAHLLAMLKARRIRPEPGCQLKVYTVIGRTRLVATVTL